MARKKKICYVFPISHKFRYPFHVALRDELEKYEIEYTVFYCAPFGPNIAKKDTAEIPWGLKVPMLKIGPLILQFGLREILKADLIIIQQENRLVLNYLLQVLDRLGLKRVAFFGHGRNYQSETRSSFAERWKKFWATRVSWWFGYTEGTRDLIVSLGYPQAQITVFNNSIDTTQVRRDIEAVDEAARARAKVELGIQGPNVAVYVGGMYKEKRLRFLIDACKLVREKVPGFSMVFIGGGPEDEFVKSAAAENDWIIYVGPRFGVDKAVLMSVARVLLMPGLVGLTILDSFAYGTPIVTTNYPFHSPEIDYLRNGENGVMVMETDSEIAYAEAVARILTDDDHRIALVEGARRSLDDFSIEAMAVRFATGVRQALELK